jgi:serine/threonine-protein kinase
MSTSTPSPPTDRDLLFGALAVHSGLLPRDELLAALKARDASTPQSLGQFAVEHHLLREDECHLLESLAQRLLERHGGDTRQCLAAVGSDDLLPQPPTIHDDRPGPLSVGSCDTPVPRTLRSETDAHSIPPPPLARPPQPRQRYRALRPHAKGGLGAVFVALDEELHREVALKEIQERHAHHPENRRRFLLEAEVTGALEHPGIVPVYGLGVYPDGRPFYAMRFIRGRSLDQAIKEFHDEGSSARPAGERILALRELLGRFVAVCNAVAYAHSRGVLHRDLKPANIMLGPYGETLVVDWGLAKVADQPDAAAGDDALIQLPSAQTVAPTAGGRVLGTPQYMSPEQASGRLDEMGPASDVYSLGATLFQLLTGKSPFPADNIQEVLRRVREGDLVPPRQVKPSVPAALDAVCRKAMAHKPKDRYASAQDLAQEVECWLADEPVRAYREPLPARLGRWARRHRALTAAAAALLLTAAVGLGVGLWAVGQEQRRTAQQRDRAEENLRQVELERQRTAEQRDLAEANLQQARRAVDQSFVLAEDDPLLRRPEFAPVRRLLLERALPFYEGFRVQRPDDPEVREELAVNSYRAGWIIIQLGGDLDKALKYSRRARDLGEQLVREHPEVARHWKDLAKSCNNIGVVHGMKGELADALPAFRRAEEVDVQLVHDHPEVPEYQSDLARARTNIGSVLQLTAKFDDALKVYYQADKVWSGLIDKYRNVLDYKVSGAGLAGNIGTLLRVTGKAKASLAWFDKAIDLLGQVRAREPNNLMAGQYLRNAYQGRAEALSRVGRLEEALRDWDQAVALDPGPRKNILRAGRAATQARAGQHARADTEARKLTRAADPGGELPYFLACTYSLAAGAARKDSQLSATERDRLAERYAATALACLEKARAAGWFNHPARVTSLKEDDDLAPLRDRPDFRKFIDTLQTPSAGR